jgi:hypothetical protein
MSRSLEHIAAVLLSCALGGPALAEASFCADPADPAKPSKPARVIWEKSPLATWKSTALGDVGDLVVTTGGEIVMAAQLAGPRKAGEAATWQPTALFRWDGDGKEAGNVIQLDLARGERVTSLASLGASGFAAVVAGAKEGDALLRFGVDGKRLWRQPLESATERQEAAGLVTLPDGGLLVTTRARTQSDSASVMRFGREGRLVWQEKLPLEASAAFATADRIRVFFAVAGAAVLREYVDGPGARFKVTPRPLAQPNDNRSLYSPMMARNGSVFFPGVAPPNPSPPPDASITRDARIPKLTGPPQQALLLRFDPALDAADMLTASGIGTGFHYAMELPGGGVAAIAGAEGVDAYHYCFVRFDAEGRETLRRRHAMVAPGSDPPPYAFPSVLRPLGDGTLLLLGRDLSRGENNFSYWMVRLAIE